MRLRDWARCRLKTLHLYLVRQVSATLILTVVVFGFVLLLGKLLREIMALIVGGQATLWVLVQALALLVPFVLVFALPMGMLTATLLVFGRLSADQELTAIRTGGVSLPALVSPILLLSVALTCLSGLINMHLAPKSRAAYKNLLIRAGMERATSFIIENRFMDDFPGYVVYVGRKRGTNLSDIFIYKLGPDKRMEARVHAARARILSDLESRQVVLRLYEVRYDDFKRWMPSYAREKDLTLDYGPAKEGKKRENLKELSYLELGDRLRELERVAAANPNPGQPTGNSHDRAPQWAAARADLTMPVRVRMHSQVSLSFASIAFTLIGVPLGIRAHRRETSAGVAMALFLVAVYYAFIILAESLQTRAELKPHLILWVPNFLFQGIGAVLLWRANRGVG